MRINTNYNNNRQSFIKNIKLQSQIIPRSNPILSQNRNIVTQNINMRSYVPRRQFLQLQFGGTPGCACGR